MASLNHLASFNLNEKPTVIKKKWFSKWFAVNSHYVCFINNNEPNIS